jgi:myo-inositol-1(or 4)-monophosphatase
LFSLEDNLALAKNAAKKAGTVAMSFFQTSKYKIKDKSFNNPVTTADHQANKVIKDILFQSDSSCGWLSEETVDSDDRLANDYVWIVDPIDGTKEFIEGVPQFSISIALVHLGEPIIGVIYNPSTNELFSASKNMGSFYNDERVKCLDQKKESIALVSRSEVKRGLWDEYKNNFKDLRPIGSVAYKLGLIGAGKGDIFVTLRPKNEWDICAGHCIINESGGVLFDLNGKLIKYNQKKTLIQPGLIAGSKNKVKSLLKIINI